MHSGTFRSRQVGVFLFFLIALAILILRLFYLQVISHQFYHKIASNQHNVSIEIPSKRGTIFDRNMRVLAINLNCDSLYANPKVVKNKRRVSKALSAILSMNESFIFDRLSRKKTFVWIKRRLTKPESDAVKALKVPGLGMMEESKRFYPNKSLACHVLGTVNIDNTGLEGIELQFNKYLKGDSGWLVTMQDAKRKYLESYQDEYVPPRNGFNFVLTIDEVIQNIAEREITKMCQKYNARGGAVIVMDPKNGDILALANYPGYDLNDMKTRTSEAGRNRAISDFFEPGSVFKIVAASAALEENVVKLDDTFFCENGEYNLGRRTLHDVHPYGTLTFKEVIGKSSNIGTVKMASRLGAAKMYKYMQLFGMYEKSGIDLPGEVLGMNRPISKWSAGSMYAIPMGQEVTTTVMQLACAISVIADGGYLVRPRIIKEIADENGQTVKDFPPTLRRKVLSPQTVANMRDVLMFVVESGTGKKAKMEDSTSAGKTGTAQKVEPGGTFSHSKFVGSFIGFAPVDKPVLAIAVSVDEPKIVYYGGDVAAPVFRVVADESLKYLNAKSAAQ